MAAKEPHASIAGVGKYLPPKVLTNHDLSKLVDTSDEWIVRRTGISERRVADDGVAASDLALPASQHALEHAGMTPEDLDLIIVATATPDMVMPSSACVLQEKLGAKNAGGFDLSAACTGFVYAMAAGEGFIASGVAKNVLVVGSECLTQNIDFTDRTTCVLFGDGAGAVVLKPADGEREILYTFVKSDGSGANLIEIPAGGSRMPSSHETIDNRMHYLKMNGQEVFKFAARTFQSLVHDSLTACGLTESDVGLIVPHQVNTRIVDQAAKGLNIPKEKIFLNLHKYGNTSAASVPIALAEAVEEGRLSKGDILILIAFGSGLTWGSAVVRW
ncbi:MAG: ketoacyl-ACP synthase III [Planctomycetota bacterium]|nr:ketoacyl-ACP synthase III [Planctomycetota bacterium]MDA1139298.1 ketoacyl-ACP synthase III [Planctomycetota bacterium]